MLEPIDDASRRWRITLLLTPRLQHRAIELVCESRGVGQKLAGRAHDNQPHLLPSIGQVLKRTAW